MINNYTELIDNTPEFREARKIVLDTLQIGLNSVDAYRSVKRYFRKEGEDLIIGNSTYRLDKIGEVYLVAFGKASYEMSMAVLDTISVKQGIIVSIVSRDNALPSNVLYIKGGHPVPDENSVFAGKKGLRILHNTTEEDLTIFLISGGGSSLFEVPCVLLDDIKKLTNLLLLKGANISEINCIRKHLSKIKGGSLTRHVKGRVVSLIISDVVGDHLDTIASGPTYFDSTSFEDAYEILKKYNLIGETPASILQTVEAGIHRKIPDTLKKDEKVSAKFENLLVATNYDACKEMLAYLNSEGIDTLYLGSSIQGEAVEVAKVVSGIASEIHSGRVALKRPAAIVFGGETTVTVKGQGIGGRNTELALSIAQYIADFRVVFASIGTDGIDGGSYAAGGIVDSKTIERAELKGLKVEEYLRNNDSFSLLNTLSDAIITGPTGTNVADIAVLLVV